MWQYRNLYKIDFRQLIILVVLMVISLLVISATDPSISHPEAVDGVTQGFFTPKVGMQIKRFALGWMVFFFFAGMDYNKLREWAPFGYLLMIVSLLGLFFVPAIQNVHRWYRIPFIGASFQPSECAKLLVVITLSWYLEKLRLGPSTLRSTLKAMVIVAIPFVLILKQPDLGTALVLCPITCVMFYLGNMHPLLIRGMLFSALLFLCCILVIFLGAVSHEDLKPYATKVLKEYQYERLNPDSHHGRAAQIAIGAGGLTGSGWRSSIFTARGWLPYAYTDSVFAAFGEEFGLFGMVLLLGLFYALVYYGFQVTAVAKDAFGQMLSAGVTIYIAMHIIVNVAMMAGLLPITGVPLPLISYGGSSVFVTMAAFGILQSIYTRRFMF